MSKEVGARVQQVRSQAEMNQREFASRLGISSGGISQIESGKTMPGGDFLLKIHQEFGIDVTWLLTGLSAGGAVPAAPAQELPRQEQEWLAIYRNSSDEVRAALRVAGDALTKPASGRRKAA